MTWLEPTVQVALLGLVVGLATTLLTLWATRKRAAVDTESVLVTMLQGTIQVYSRELDIAHADREAQEVRHHERIIAFEGRIETLRVEIVGLRAEVVDLKRQLADQKAGAP